MKLYSVVGYLLLVSFTHGTAQDLSPDVASVMKDSPYDGIAVQYLSAYDHGPVNHAALEKRYSAIAEATGKHVWPWIFLNRIIGHVKGDNEPTPEKEYFSKIKGMDIFGKSSNLDAFIDLWRSALRTAKKTGAPGVVLDLEAYNDYKTYEFPYLVGRSGREAGEVRDRLVSLGAAMADVAAVEYPGSIIWSFFSRLGDRSKCTLISDKGCTSVSLIVLGFLNRCKEKGYHLTFVGGGEWGLGYCNKDVATLKSKIALRAENSKGALSLYPNLRLGGVIAPWPDTALKKGWLLKKRCAECDVKDAMGFVPYFKELADSYEYVWIYAAGLAGYNPLNRDVSARMNKALVEAFGSNRVRRGSQLSTGNVPRPEETIR